MIQLYALGKKKLHACQEKVKILNYLSIARSKSSHKVGRSGGGIDVAPSIYSFICYIYAKKVRACKVAHQTDMYRRIIWMEG